MLVSVCLLLVLSASAAEGSEIRFVGRKCCPPDERLDVRRKVCVPRADTQISEEMGSRAFTNGSLWFKTITGKETSPVPRLVELLGTGTELACSPRQRLIYSSNVSCLYPKNSKGNVSIGFVEFGFYEKFKEGEFCLDTGITRGVEHGFVMVCARCQQDCISFCDSENEGLLELRGKNYTKQLSELHHCRKTRIDAESFNVLDLPPSDYCLDTKPTHNETEKYFVCIDRVAKKNTLKAVLSLISFLSLAVITLIHIVIREFRKQPGTKIKLGIYWNLMLLFLLLFVSNIKNLQEFAGVCVAVGIGIQFFGLSAFFWMTTLSYDIWQRLRSMRSPDEANPFTVRRYTIFSAGCPLLISCITLVIQLTTPDNLKQTKLHRTEGGVFDEPEDNGTYFTHPGIGRHSCFLASTLPKVLYFHSEVMVLLLCNIIFFLAICYNFFLGPWRPSSKAFRVNYHQKFGVLVQIFTFMGIFWVTENIQAILQWQEISSRWFVILDILNLLTGLFLLVLFISLKSNRQILAGALSEFKKQRVSRFIAGQQSKGSSSTNSSRINRNRRLSGTIRSVLSEDTPSPQPDPSMHPAFPQPPNSSTQPNLASSPKVVNRSASIQSQDSIATSTSGLERQSSNGLTTPPVNSSNAPPFLQLPSAASALGSNSKHRPNLNGGFQMEDAEEVEMKDKKEMATPDTNQNLKSL